MRILSRRTKNNPVLIGEAGVGKTAVAEGLAQRIVSDDIPESLKGKRVLALDVGGLVAGTRFRDFEERMQQMLKELQQEEKDIILFIDELHSIVGAGGAEGAVNASSMLKPRSRAASSRSSGPPRSTSTASTWRRTRRWSGASSPCSSTSRRWMRRFLYSSASGTVTRRTTGSRSEEAIIAGPARRPLHNGSLSA